MDPSINSYDVGKAMTWTINNKECKLSNKLKKSYRREPDRTKYFNMIKSQAWELYLYMLHTILYRKTIHIFLSS